MFWGQSKTPLPNSFYSDPNYFYVINHPLNVDAIDRVGAHKAPEIGEHSDAILAEMGLSSEQIEELRGKGVIQ